MKSIFKVPRGTQGSSGSSHVSYIYEMKTRGLKERSPMLLSPQNIRTGPSLSPH